MPNKFIWPDKDFQYNTITYGFDVRSGMPIDRRFVLTKDQMKALSKPPLSILMPDTYFCVLKDENKTKLYVYNWNNQNIEDSEGKSIGKFRLYQEGYPIADPNDPSKTLKPDENGVVSLPIASEGVLGLVMPDGETIIVSEGKLMATTQVPEVDDITIKLNSEGKLEAQYAAGDGLELDGVAFKASVDDKTIKIVDGKLVGYPEPLEDGKATHIVYGTSEWDKESIDVLYSEGLDLKDNHLVVNVKEDEGLKVDQDGLAVVLKDHELVFDSGEIALVIKDDAGLEKTSEGLRVNLEDLVDSEKAIIIDGNKLGVSVDDETIKIQDGKLVAKPEPLRAGDGINIIPGTSEWDEETISVVVHDSEGLEIKDGKLAVKVDGDTIVFDSEGKLKGAKKLEANVPVFITSEQEIELHYAEPLFIENSELVVKVVKPLDVQANGINLLISEGLEVVGDKLRAKIDSEGLKFEDGAIKVKLSDFGMQLRNNELATKIDKGLMYASEGADIPHAMMAHVDDYTIKFGPSDELVARSIRAGEAIDLTESEGEQVINICVDGMTVFYNSAGDVIELHLDGDHAIEMSSEGLAVKADERTIIFTSEGGDLQAIDFYNSELGTRNKYGVDAINELLTFLGHSEWGIDGHTEDYSVRYILSRLSDMVGTAGYAQYDENANSEADNPDIRTALMHIFKYLGDVTGSEYDLVGTDVGEIIQYILSRMGDFNLLVSEGIPSSSLVAAILNLLARINATKPMILDNSASEFGGQVLRLVETSEDRRLSVKLNADSPVKAIAYGTGDYYLGVNSFDHHFKQSSSRTSDPLTLNIGPEAGQPDEKSRSLEYNPTTTFLEVKPQKGVAIISQADDSEGRRSQPGVSVNVDNETVKVYGWKPVNDLDISRSTGAYANKLYVNHDVSLKAVEISGNKYLGVSSYSASFEWDGTTTSTYTSPYFTSGDLMVQVRDPDGWVVYPDIRVFTYPHPTDQAKVQVRFNAGFNAGTAGFYDILILNVGHKAPASDNYN